jgi:hypothetical protein
MAWGWDVLLVKGLRRQWLEQGQSHHAARSTEQHRVACHQRRQIVRRELDKPPYLSHTRMRQLLHAMRGRCDVAPAEIASGASAAAPRCGSMGLVGSNGGWGYAVCGGGGLEDITVDSEQQQSPGGSFLNGAQVTSLAKHAARALIRLVSYMDNERHPSSHDAELACIQPAKHPSATCPCSAPAAHRHNTLPLVTSAKYRCQVATEPPAER